MIADQQIGKSFMGALSYHLRKMNFEEGRRAELLDTNFGSMDLREIKQEVDLLRSLHPHLNRYVYHTSLNFSKEDEAFLTNEKLLNIAHDYLQQNGFIANQYFIFRHYDSGHPHIHLLVNRIGFDGKVVSDSNNYKRSEAILRSIERQYNLAQAVPSIRIPIKAPRNNELEMVRRTGKASDKMVVQELLKGILKQKNLSLSDFIKAAEQKGIYFLFNQASTGRVTGVTYFYQDFKAKGQALGNQFKWPELIKQLDYEQSRDGKAVSQANSRTAAIYGSGKTEQQQRAKGQYPGQGSNGFYPGHAADPESFGRDPAAADQPGGYAEQDRTTAHPAAEDPDNLSRDTADTLHHDTFDLNIQIAEDIDDEKVLGSQRRRKR